MSVVESPHRELELIGVIHHGFKIWDGVAMSVDVHLASQCGGQGFPPKLGTNVRVVPSNYTES